VSALDRRLTALEQLAEHCRIREYREMLGAELTRHHAAAGIPISAGELDAKVTRALALAETMALLAAGGLTLDEIARRVAVERDLDPDRVAATFAELRAARGATA